MGAAFSTAFISSSISDHSEEPWEGTEEKGTEGKLRNSLKGVVSLLISHKKSSLPLLSSFSFPLLALSLTKSASRGEQPREDSCPPAAAVFWPMGRGGWANRSQSLPCTTHVALSQSFDFPGP